jgi:CheY-like chemotaxis protein
MTVPLRRAVEGETVLVVEDDVQVLSAAVESLKDLGYRVLAHDAADALELLKGDERVDILFSDVIMPGCMNGVQLSVEASRLRPALKMLLTSGYTGAALTNEHEVSADVPILNKPYRREELADQLRLVLSSA